MTQLEMSDGAARELVQERRRELLNLCWTTISELLKAKEPNNWKRINNLMKIDDLLKGHLGEMMAQEVGLVAPPASQNALPSASVTITKESRELMIEMKNALRETGHNQKMISGTDGRTIKARRAKADKENEVIEPEEF
jgi:hypothetical protein